MLCYSLWLWPFTDMKLGHKVGLRTRWVDGANTRYMHGRRQWNKAPWFGQNLSPTSGRVGGWAGGAKRGCRNCLFEKAGCVLMNQSLTTLLIRPPNVWKMVGQSENALIHCSLPWKWRFRLARGYCVVIIFRSHDVILSLLYVYHTSGQKSWWGYITRQCTV